MRREEANQLVVERLTRADAVLVDVRRALDVLPGMRPNMVLTSGPLLPWSEYEGNPRLAILYAAVHEGLAGSADEAEAKIRRGEILVDSAHAHGCAATVFAVCTASMPLYVVEERVTGRRGCANIFEGDSPRRIGTGCYGEDVVERLRFVHELVAPTIGEAVRRTGGLPLMPIIQQGFRLGDDMHVRTSAGTMLFVKALRAAFEQLGTAQTADVQRTLSFLEGESFSFFRVWLAAAKAVTDSAGGIERSSIITHMSMNARHFAIRVSGLGDQWFFGPHPRFEGRLRQGSEDADRVVERFHDGVVTDETAEWISRDQALPDQHRDFRYLNSDCMLTECMGLGAFASAGTPSLQPWHGVSMQTMIERNLLMYDITWGEHPVLKIRRFGDRGVPIGIDVFKVLDRRTTPMLNGSMITKTGVILGTGIVCTPIECMEQAARAYRARYGDDLG